MLALFRRRVAETQRRRDRREQDAPMTSRDVPALMWIRSFTSIFTPVNASS
jgi:hypothetical protein